MTIIYFYSEVMGYTMAVVKSLVKDYGAEVHVVYWDKNQRTPFVLPELEGVTYYPRSQFDHNGLCELVGKLNPRIIYVSGRMDRAYLSAARFAKKRGVITVSGFDAPWDNTWKSSLIALAGAWLYRRYFDFIWVPGPYQYEFARKLGYQRERIIWNLLSADSESFVALQHDRINDKFSKRFIFAGRLADEKGIDVLIEAFLKNYDAGWHDWSLIIAGNGPKDNIIPSHPAIIKKGFLQPVQLREAIREGGVFVLPSRREPWGVVLHEFALAGFPIICSDVCGASTTFVKKNYNGYTVEVGSVEALRNAMLGVMHLGDSKLFEMGERSREVGLSINPQISAASLISIVK